MDESTKAEEWRIERAKRMNSNAVKETRDATPTDEENECDKFYEGVRTDFMRALDREDVAVKLLVEAGIIKSRDEWFEKYGLPALRPDAAPAKKSRSDKGKHHKVAGVLQEDVDEAEN